MNVPWVKYKSSPPSLALSDSSSSFWTCCSSFFLLFLYVFIVSVVSFLAASTACVILLPVPAMIMRSISILRVCILIFLGVFVEMCTLSTTDVVRHISRVMFEVLDHIICFQDVHWVFSELVLEVFNQSSILGSTSHKNQRSCHIQFICCCRDCCLIYWRFGIVIFVSFWCNFLSNSSVFSDRSTICCRYGVQILILIREYWFGFRSGLVT